MSKVYNNGIVSPKGFDMSAGEPVDQREIVANKVDLYTLRNAYPGLTVKVRDEEYKEYKLIRTPVDDIANWVESPVKGDKGDQGEQGIPGGLDSEATNTQSVVFDNMLGNWAYSPTSPLTASTITYDLTNIKNGGLCAVYYKGNVLDKTKFIGGTTVILSGSNVLDELCLVWVVYDAGSNSFHVNIQTGFTGDIPVTDETAATITVTDAAATETAAIITVT